MKIFAKFIMLLISFWMSGATSALVYPLPAAGDDVIGQTQIIFGQAGDDWHSIGRRYGVGYYEMLEANRPINPKMEIADGTRIIIPTQYILPSTPRTGLVINIAEMRLFYYPPGEAGVVTAPVGIGRAGWITPVGVAKILRKQKDPTWYVPPTVRTWAASEGRILPEIVKPGPENPLGEYALYLSIPAYLIHGTNEASGVGMRSSSGCVRMFPEDIKWMYENIPVGTSVRIVNEPYKVGFIQKKMYLEVHQPLQEDAFSLPGKQPTLTTAVNDALLFNKSLGVQVDWQLAQIIAKKQQGIPMLVGTRLAATNAKHPKATTPG